MARDTDWRHAVSTRHEIVQRFDDSPAAKQPLETLVRSLRETLELLAPEATPETLRDAECTIRLRRLKFVPVHKFMKLAASNSVPKEDLTRLKEAGLIRIWRRQSATAPRGGTRNGGSRR